MAKKNWVSAIVTLCLVLVLAMQLFLPTVAEAAGNNKKNDKAGTGQLEVHIHHVGGITKNKGTVTIMLPDGRILTGTLTGSTLTFCMNTTENGFDIAKGESLTVPYITGDDRSGMLTITHKEGNGTNISDEFDQGLNNFNGSYAESVPATTQAPTVTEPTVPATTQAPAVTEPVTEPVTQPEAELEDLLDEDVPLADTPVEPTIIIVITEEPRPGNPPTLEELLDEEVPLTSNPKTGDPTILLTLMAVLSGGGMLMLTSKKKD